MDAFLDSAEERAHLFDINTPVFNHAIVRGGEEVANLTVFAEMNSEPTPEKSVFPDDTCPSDKNCMCVPHTLAKELLNK